ncbi:mitochondrial acyl carrier protein [Saitoella coloradoensis]
MSLRTSLNLLGAVRTAARTSPALRIAAAQRFYASAGPDVETRILDILREFGKVQDPTKVTPSANFAKDLGLDSLDVVEVVMAIEEEFSIELSDKDADALTTVAEAIAYVKAQPDAK